MHFYPPKKSQNFWSRSLFFSGPNLFPAMGFLGFQLSFNHARFHARFRRDGYYLVTGRKKAKNKKSHYLLGFIVLVIFFYFNITVNNIKPWINKNYSVKSSYANNKSNWIFFLKKNFTKNRIINLYWINRSTKIA